MNKLEKYTILKILIFLFLMCIAVFYPKNLIDTLSSNFLVSISKNGILFYVAKLISFIFSDKFLLFLMLVLSILLFFIKEYKKSVFILSTAFFGGIIGIIIKNIIKRQRPLHEIYDGYSFPSGHSLTIAIFFLSLLFIINNKDILTIITKICLFIVPLSRIIVGAHYISDVLAGVLLGSIIIDILKIYYLKLYFIVIKILGINNEKG